MNQLTFLLVTLVVYLSIPIAIYLIRKAPEEQHEQKTNLKIAHICISLFIPIPIALSLFKQDILLALLAVVLSVTFILKKPLLTQSILGIYTGLLVTKPNALLVFAPLVIIHNIIHIARIYNIKQSNIKSIMKTTISYLVLANVVALIIHLAQ